MKRTIAIVAGGDSSELCRFPAQCTGTLLFH